MSRIVTLSRFFAKSMIREKASYLFGVLAVAILVVSLGLSGTDIGFRYKLFEDILLTSQGYFFIVAALFYAFMALSRERNLGIFVLPLANGMRRCEYLLALMFSLVWIISILFALFFLLDMLFLYGVEGTIYPPVLWQLFLYYLVACMVAFLIVSLSHYVSLTNAVLYALAFFLIGNALDELYLYAWFMTDSPFLQQLSSVLYYLLPNFSLFDLQGIVVNRHGADIWQAVGLPLAYFTVWSALLYGLAWVRFRKKALSVGS